MRTKRLHPILPKKINPKGFYITIKKKTPRGLKVSGEISNSRMNEILKGIK